MTPCVENVRLQPHELLARLVEFEYEAPSHHRIMTMPVFRRLAQALL